MSPVSTVSASTKSVAESNVPPLAAGLCAGLGVHIARLWIK
jgi:hypothetical protein